MRVEGQGRKEYRGKKNPNHNYGQLDTNQHKILE